jgi:addiction module HigA family antidote
MSDVDLISDEKQPPVHPGEILSEEFMKPLGLSSGLLARDLDIPANRISEIVAGRRAVTADTAIRLGIYFGTDAQFWLNLQNRYDLDKAEDEAGEKIRARVRRRAA